MKRTELNACILAALVSLAAVGTAQATEYEWSMDLDCSLCHQREVASLELASDKPGAQADKTAQEDNSTASLEMTAEEAAHAAEVSGYLPMHASTFGVGCVTCHADTDGLEKGHQKLNSGKVAKRLKKSTVETELCANCHKIEELAKTTSDYAWLADSAGTVVNPHALPENESHAAVKCTGCHTAHKGESVVETTLAYCGSCHHAGVYECGTCHEA